MHIRTETVSPEVAASYLMLNTSNRPLNKSHVNNLANQMKNGLWMQDGSPIRFSASPKKLLDGQHRLQAVINAETPQTFVIIEDLPNETFQTIDTGRGRGPGDCFAISEIPNSALSASVCTFLNAFYNKKYTAASSSGGGKECKLNNEQLLQFYASRPELEQCVADGHKFYTAFRLLRPTVYASMLYIFSKIDFTPAYDFFNKLSTGANLDQDHPIAALRKKLIDDYTSKSKITNLHKLALVIVAWNAFRKGRKLSFVKWDGNVDNFPKPI